MELKMRNLILTAIMVIFSFSGMVTAIAAETYKVALDGTFAPHAMPKMDGGVEGFNVDLANEIGKRLGVKMDITAAQ